MISERIQGAFNKQINYELYSSYLYLAMSAKFEVLNLPGFGNWMRVQAQEELIHVMKFYTHLIERGGAVKMSAIDAPPGDWENALGIFEYTLKHEQKVSGLVNELMDLAIEEKDHAAGMFLQWFVTEQVEEEKNVGDVLNQLKLAADVPAALYMLDKEMGQRVLPPPAAN